jgi:hypothetical protein
MSVSGVNSAPPGLPAPSTAPVSSTAKALDGDYKTHGANRSTVKDADGDYKPLSPTPAANSSSGVQAALTNLKAGG